MIFTIKSNITLLFFLDFCTEDRYHDRTGRYIWPETRVGMMVEIVCPHGSKTISEATRHCLINANGVPQWSKPYTSNCKEVNKLHHCPFFTSSL